MKNNSKSDLIKLLKKNNDRSIILYGAASRGVRVLYNLIGKGVSQKQILFCDSNPKLWNTSVCNVKVISLNELHSFPKDTCIIISSSMRYEIIPLLEKFGFTEVHYFHSLLFAEQMYEKYDSKSGIPTKIIKKIQKEIPELYFFLKSIEQNKILENKRVIHLSNQDVYFTLCKRRTRFRQIVDSVDITIVDEGQDIFEIFRVGYYRW